jgi:hypothetical protein
LRSNLIGLSSSGPDGWIWLSETSMNLLRLDWKISYSSLLSWAEATCWRRLTVLLRTLRSISTAGTLAELPEPPSLLWSLTDSTPSLRFSAFRIPTLFHNGRSVIYYYYPFYCFHPDVNPTHTSTASIRLSGGAGRKVS